MNKLVAIIGPTGIGKTKLAIQLAHFVNGEIVTRTAAKSTAIWISARLNQPVKNGHWYRII